jgi:hypothetical protein
MVCVRQGEERRASFVGSFLWVNTVISTTVCSSCSLLFIYLQSCALQGRKESAELPNVLMVRSPANLHRFEIIIHLSSSDSFSPFILLKLHLIFF